ncbi:MAG: hypothetical protein IJ576_05490 [Synergistaceae bacterium]|nr:hypothetical protein [Synergistaceae bacterium]MBR1602327.1 hypothetical protein [Synergistaceae bacterium]
MMQDQKAKTNFDTLTSIADDDDDYEMSDEELANAPWFIEGEGRTTVYFSVDDFVLDYFKKKSKNAYLVMMSDALRDYVLAQRKLEAERTE